MSASVLLTIGTVLVLVAFIPAVGVLRTWRGVDWRSSDLGKVMHAKAVSIVEVLSLSLLAGVLQVVGIGRPWWFEAIRLVAFLHVAVSLWRQWRAYKAIIRDHDLRADDPREKSVR